ncbi:hypothetical protein V8F20_011422 [Naviculisporaceae sp. PSN 640]
MDSVMRELHLDVHLGMNESFSLSPQTLTSASTISSCNSDYSPFTPTSGRSTPPRSNSMDFGASFDSYNSMSSYDFTPPSSAVSTSFSINSSFTSDGSGFLLPELPVTPTRNRANPEFSCMNLSPCGGQTQTTPSQDISAYSFNEDPFNSAFTLTPGYGNNWDASPMWVHPDSPMSFPVNPVMSAPTQAPMRSLDGVRKTSAALQRKTSKTLKKSPVCRSRTRKSLVKQHQGPGEYDIIPKPKWPCEARSCSKIYQRKEHMMRHMRSFHPEHGKEKEEWHCQWCKHDTNRGDNFKTHLEKHLRPETKSPRVNVVHDPVERAKIEAQLATLGTRSRKGVKSEAKPKAKPVSKL